MMSTLTSVLFFWPHCLAHSEPNQASYSGTKCAHFAIFSVFVLAKASGEKVKNGPAAALAAASLMKSRRGKRLVILEGAANPILAQANRPRQASPTGGILLHNVSLLVRRCSRCRRRRNLSHGPLCLRRINLRRR